MLSKKGAAALDNAIAIWAEYARLAKVGKLSREDTKLCPLCAVNNCCIRCPILIKVGGCRNTVFYKWSTCLTRRKVYIPELHRLTREMLALLRACKREQGAGENK